MLTRALHPDYDTRLVAGRPPAREGEMRDPAVEVTYVPLVRDLRLGTDVHALRSLRRLLNDWEPLIVHTHQAKAGALTRLAARRRGATPATVHTFHGHVLDGYFGRMSRSAFLTAERFLARRTDVLIGVSREVRDDLLELGIGEESQWMVIPLGFDLGDFLRADARDERLRQELRLGPEDLLVGVVGRLAPIKDHATLLSAISRLEGVHLAIFGDGELREDLLKQTASLGLGDRVHFMGWRTDIAPVMAGLDVVALTSRNEGTPVSLIEALASARPVVATDVGGVRSVVVDGVSGFIVPTESPQDVADALEALLEDPNRRSEMGEAGRSFVAERFSAERLVSDIRTLYSSLLKSR